MINKAIEKLKKEEDFVILAHYYVDGGVQEIADFVGDSYFLSKTAMSIENKNILFAGVSFMGESAKLLNPEKKVYMADITADCPMAHMVEADDIKNVRDKYEDTAVVCYINSSAEIKAYSDCSIGERSKAITEILRSKGIKAYNLKGGFGAWLISNNDMLSKKENMRYSRQMILPQIGKSGQEKLKKSKVFIQRNVQTQNYTV